MVTEFNSVLTKSDVVESPKDVILDGVVIKIERGALKEFLKPEVHSKFDNLDQDTLYFHYEVKFENRIIKGNDKMPYYEKPGSNSNLGKFLNRYNELKSGCIVKIIYDGNGMSNIKLD